MSHQPHPPFPRAFWWLLSGIFINRMGSFVYAFLTLYLTTKQHFSPKEAGFFVALYGLGSLLAGPVGGYLADRLGRRVTLVFATCAGAAAMLYVSWAHTPGELARAIWLLGFFGDLYRPAAHAWIADLVPPEQRTRAYGWVYFVSNIGFASSALTAGLVAKLNFSLLFWMDAATTMTFGLLVFAVVPEPALRTQRERLSLWESLQPYRRFAFVGFLLTQMWVEVMYHQSTTTLSLYMKANGLSEREFGYMGAVNGVLVVLFQPVLIRWIPGLPKRRALVLGALFVGGGFGLLAGANKHLFGYVCANALWTFGEVVFACTIPSIVVAMAPEHLRGSYQGAYQLMLSSALVTAPLLGTQIFERWGHHTVWWGCLGLGLLVAGAHASLARLYRHTAAGATGVDLQQNTA